MIIFVLRVRWSGGVAQESKQYYECEACARAVLRGIRRLSGDVPDSEKAEREEDPDVALFVRTESEFPIQTHLRVEAFDIRDDALHDLDLRPCGAPERHRRA
jgi:hypothetical protein